MPPPPRRRTHDEIEEETLKEERSGFDLTWPQAFAIAAMALAISASEIARYSTYADRVAAKTEAAKAEAELNGLLDRSSASDD